MHPASPHSLLLKQVQEHLGDTKITPELQVLLEAVSRSYTNFDATLQHRTDQLIASTSRAYSFLDSIHKGFMMCDTSGEIVLTNGSLRQMLATKDSAAAVSLSTETVSAMFDPGVRFKERILQCLKSSKPSQQNEVNFGGLVLRLNFAPLLNDAGSASQQLLGVVILVEDITEQKVLERSKDEFLSIASHELRTPLTAIRGNASLIKKYYGASITDPDMTEMIDDIHEGAVRLIGIVNDFLDVAAIEQGKIEMHPETFALADVMSEVVRELEGLCNDKNLQLRSDQSVQAAPVVTADKQRIKQVIINLVGNAVKFTDEGSITISIWSDAQFVHTVVTDTGKGMSEENQKLLFRKFQQAGTSLLTRDTTKGTGLGLYISKLIVKLSGGTIGLQSSTLGGDGMSGGSAFAFSLPLGATQSVEVL
jgi:signal transduction histidine kinase